jgi:hypothetical protein
MFASQKHLDHLGLFYRGRKLTFKDLLAGVEHDDAVGDVFDQAHQMLDHDDRHPGCSQRLDAPGDPVEFCRIEAGGNPRSVNLTRVGRDLLPAFERTL